MSVARFRRLFDYSYWAWERVFVSIGQLDDEAYWEKRPLFDQTIHGTLVHCQAAEWLWLNRLQGQSPKAMWDVEKFDSFTAVRTHWQTVREDWRRYLQELTDKGCDQIIQYRSTEGQLFSLPARDIMQQVINHATEHRSQLTPILYHLNVPTEPLDYLFYCLE